MPPEDNLIHPVVQRESMLAVVLAASEWPSYPDFDASPSFRRSADDIVNYLRRQDGLNLPKQNTKVLIDTDDFAQEVLNHIRSFIRARRNDLQKRGTPVTDLLFYYVGHGDFVKNDVFFMAIRSTDKDEPLASSITADALGRLIRDEANGLRVYLVLDCCFAAAATNAFQSDGPIGMAEIQLSDALPPQGDFEAIRKGRIPEYGTATLCASGPRERAKAPKDAKYTMFTGALLDVFNTGDPKGPAWLSLEDTQRIVMERLATQFLHKAVLPQVHAPKQRMGRVDTVPLFRNLAKAIEEEHEEGCRQAADSAHRAKEAPEQAANAIAQHDLNAIHERQKKEQPETEEVTRSAAAKAQLALATKPSNEKPEKERKVLVIASAVAAAAGIAIVILILSSPPQSSPPKITIPEPQNSTSASSGQAGGTTANPPSNPSLSQPPTSNSPGNTPQGVDLVTLDSQAYSAYMQKNFEEALKLFQSAADHGDATAQFYLGVMYEHGLGIPQDYETALKFYRWASEQGFPRAENNLASMYEHGRGVPQNYYTALNLYRLAADKGFPMAEFNLGLMYENGHGVPQNDGQARALITKAADAGLSDAKNWLEANATNSP
jgi:hypothetical protein